MECILIEKTYVGDEFCFFTTESSANFTVAICTHKEYYNNEFPESYLVGIYNKENGYTAEKIEAMLDDDVFVFSAVKDYVAFLSEHQKVIKNKFLKKEDDINGKLDSLQETLTDSLKVNWTLEEASKYSHIGIRRIRAESNRKDCPWTIWVGEGKRMVKVDEFKKWLSERTAVC